MVQDWKGAMSGWMFLVGGLLIGFAIGRSLATNAAKLRGSTIAMAAVSFVMDATYGVEWRDDFLEEVQVALDSEALTSRLLREYLKEAK